MAYYDTITVVSGDSKPDLILTLRDSNKANITPAGTVLDPDDPTTWDPIAIGSSEIFVYFKALGSSSIIAVLEATYDNPADANNDGKCTMSWINPDTGITALKDLPAGIYEGEIVITENGQSLTVFDKLKFKVRDRFA